MKFRTLQTLIIVGAIVLVAAATVIAAQVLLESSARERIAASVDGAHEVFEDSYARARDLHAAQAEVVANAPRLKAVVATGDVDRATILDVAQELQESVGSEIFIVLDGGGRLVADTQVPEAEGVSLAERPIVAQALAQGRATAAWADDSGVYQVSARRLEFGREVVGVLILGHELGGPFLASITTPTRTAAVLSVDGVVATSSLGPQGVPDEGLTQALAASTVSAQLDRLDLSGNWLAKASPLAAYSGERSVNFTVGRSVEVAMQDSRALRRALWVIGLLATLGGMAGAYLLAGRIARPLEDMSRLAQSFGKGDFSARVPLSGPREAITLGTAMHDMADRLVDARDELVAKERLEGEMEIAERIQTSILPGLDELPGLAFGGYMRTADEVGGDYYDVIPQDTGCWLAIGDVAGHGLKAGLVMMMLQSAVSVAARYASGLGPDELLTRVNATLYDNVRERLDQDEHITLTLLRYYPDGRVTHAGAHEDLLIHRATTGEIECIRTQGTWVGILPDVAGLMPLQEFQLAAGDTLLLYTDGITEARSGEGEEFGFDRLITSLREFAHLGPQGLVEALGERVGAHTELLDDDITMLALQRRS
jgi:sigma-B regulation protein RsbU (phosphoserine phosphatase)